MYFYFGKYTHLTFLGYFIPTAFLFLLRILGTVCLCVSRLIYDGILQYNYDAWGFNTNCCSSHQGEVQQLSWIAYSTELTSCGNVTCRTL